MIARRVVELAQPGAVDVADVTAVEADMPFLFWMPAIVLGAMLEIFNGETRAVMVTADARRRRKVNRK